MPQVTLRDARWEDVDALFEIHRAALGEYVAQTWHWDEAAQAAHFRRHFDSARRRVIVCDGRTAGFLDVERRDGCLALVNIEIAPPHQGQGIGSRLIQELLDQARLEGSPVRLQVLRVNHRAKALYERLGFVVIGETPTHYQMECV